MRALPHLRELHAHGRAWLARGARRAIARVGVPFDLDALPETALVDPRVHAFFYGSDATLPLAQVLVGFLPAETRPSCTRVVADAQGIVHMPGIGHARGLAPHATAELRWDGAWSLPGAEIVAPRFVGGIELARVADPSLSNVLQHDVRDVGRCAVLHRRALSRALVLLHAIDPGYVGGELLRDAALLVLFRSATLGSCANVSAYRAAFLRCDDDATAPFFCEDLAHQIGHATFHAVTADPRRCFRIPPGTPLASIGGRSWDHRTLFDALHGNFTMTRMVEVLDGLLALPLEPLERAEVIGRLAQALWKLEHGLADVDDPRLFTPEIRAMHLAMRELATTMRARHGARVAAADLRDQPYAFSWSIYRRHNGLTEPNELVRYGSHDGYA